MAFKYPNSCGAGDDMNVDGSVVIGDSSSSGCKLEIHAEAGTDGLRVIDSGSAEMLVVRDHHATGENVTDFQSEAGGLCVVPKGKTSADIQEAIDYLAGKSISNVTVDSPAVITSTGHGLATGERIIIEGTVTTPTINGERTVTVINADTFSVGVNTTVVTTGNGAWRRPGTVYLPAGEYTVSDTIIVKDGITLVGAGINATILKAATADIAVIQFNTGSPRVKIRNLKIDGNDQSGITGIVVWNDENHNPVGILNNLWITGTDANRLTRGILVASWSGEIYNCKVEYCDTGIDLFYQYDTTTTPADDWTNAVSVTNTNVMFTTDGIKIRGQVNRVSNCLIAHFTDNGIYIDCFNDQGGFGNTISGCYLETPGTPVYEDAIGIFIKSQGNTITGNYFDLIYGDQQAIDFESDEIKYGNTLLGNYHHNNITLPNYYKYGEYKSKSEIYSPLEISNYHLDGVDMIYTDGGASTTVEALLYSGTSQVSTTGTTDQIDTSGNAFVNVERGTRIITAAGTVVVVQRIDDNHVIVDQTVNWSSQDFEYQKPVFKGMEVGVQLAASTDVVYITAITDNFEVTVDREVNWYNSGDGYTFSYEFPLFKVNDGTANRLLVRPDGSIGLGTTEPDAKLSVFGNGAKITVNGTSDGTGDARKAMLNLRIDTTNLWQVGTDNEDSNKFFIRAADSDANKFFNIDGTGKVGIGTVNPGAKLEVNGMILVSDTGSGRYLAYTQDDVGGTQNYGLWYEDAAHALSIWTHTQQRLTVNDDGDVGIGVTNPGAKLEVNGMIRISDTGSGRYLAYTQDDVGGTQNYGLWYEDAAHALSIWTHTQQRLTVSDDGDVGIGVTPTAKLDVAGKIKANNGTNAALNLPILTSDPASPVVGDVWIRNTSGTYSLKVRVNSTTTKSVTLS